jgi:myo-inositol 2-dehydrogenase/D-chiro-inositol 1-dehydrogenase
MEFLKVSGGMFHDCATHDIDMVLKITGEAPSSIYAQAHSFDSSIAAIGDVDCIAITMKFPSGTIASINLDRTSPYGYDQRLEVLGDKAMMISDNPKPTAVQLHSSEGEKLDKCYYSFPQRYAESYKGALNHFIDVLQGKARNNVTAEQVLLVCRVADACDISCRTQQVVKIQN